jgi:hypothetical protein
MHKSQIILITSCGSTITGTGTGTVSTGTGTGTTTGTYSETRLFLDLSSLASESQQQQHNTAKQQHLCMNLISLLASWTSDCNCRGGGDKRRRQEGMLTMGFFKQLLL